MPLIVMPDLIRHPEGFEKTGFQPEFIPTKVGTRMTFYYRIGNENTGYN
jgi:hypothetical protein